jgi:hypothetical protein
VALYDCLNIGLESVESLTPKQEEAWKGLAWKIVSLLPTPPEQLTQPQQESNM